MEAHELTAKGSDQKKSSVLSMEQRRKFEELRARRLQLKNAQEAKEKKKQKKRKRGKKGEEHSEASEMQPSVEESNSPQAAKFGSEQRHVFAMNSGKATALGGDGGGLSPSGSSQAAALGGYGNLEIVPSTTTTSKSPFGTAAGIPAARNPEVSQKKPKRKKLHWGMEIKERWERKGNM